MQGNPAFRAAVAALVGADCDYRDALVRILLLEMRQECAGVRTWVNSACADKEATGKRLAEHVNAGGHVDIGHRSVVVPRGVTNPKRAATSIHCRCTVSWTGKTYGIGAAAC
jgi:hypothetical protein